MKHITSRQNALVTRGRAVAQGADRTRLLLDGVHLVSEALAAGLTIQEAAVAQAALASPEVGTLVNRLIDAGVDVVTAAPAVMSALSPVQSASPIVALAARRSLTDRELFQARPAVIVAAVDVQQPGNVGAIARVAEAGGATGVVIAGQTADPFGWKALRGSMGSAFRLPLVSRSDTLAVIATARDHGCRIVASVPRSGQAPDQAHLGGSVLLLVGGEGSGLPAAAISAADERVTIPMAAPVESLNTAVCAALLVYEARRQRLALNGHGFALSGQS